MPEHLPTAASRSRIEILSEPGQLSADWSRNGHTSSHHEPGDEVAASLLEIGFPALAVSRVVAADSRAKDPSYAAHRWWARRPPSLMRAILLAATMDGEATERDFWHRYADDGPHLEGLSVHDPFMGGGTTLIEASRLGAEVSGSDVDPTAHLIVGHSLDPAQESEIQDIGDALLSFLRKHFSSLYPDDEGEQLHSFWIATVTCPHCGTAGPLYRSLVLARDCGKAGAVLRDDGATVFDPETLEVSYLTAATQRQFKGASHEWAVDHSTFDALKYRCPSCQKRSGHRELQSGAAPRKLVAIERTAPGRRRKLFGPGDRDLAALDLADELLGNPPVALRLPDAEFEPVRRDPRPRSFGIIGVRDLFTARQLLVLGAAHAWVDAEDMSKAAERAVRLVLSSALMTNNRLCSYATDYGRLSPLYSVRGYSLPALAVELNPLHSSGGRGTLRQCLNRVLRSTTTTTRRATWDVTRRTTEKVTLNLPQRAPSVDVRCSSAADAVLEAPIDLLVFDPPYYDYIQYDELTELFRAWDPSHVLSGETLQSAAADDAATFGLRLADCLRPALAVRKGGRPVAFTYHSAKPPAWEAIGVALDRLDLRVTAMWPVRSDGHMGHHSRPGSCAWDVVVVCRPARETYPTNIGEHKALWSENLDGLEIGDADLTSFKLAHEMAASRFGTPKRATRKSTSNGGTDGY